MRDVIESIQVFFQNPFSEEDHNVANGKWHSIVTGVS